MQSKTVVSLAVIALALLAGWLVLGKQGYEECLKSAAKAANGVPLAYLDLRGICEDKKVDQASKISFDDLVPTK